MIKPIVTSQLMLRMPSEDATPADAPIAQDLVDTLRAHADECVGVAANMIGVRKRIIAVMDGSMPIVMYNPQIISSNGEYTAVESCLSLTGERSATRFRSIEVNYLDEGFRPRTKHFCGFTAQIIQHEIDHCNGIVI